MWLWVHIIEITGIWLCFVTLQLCGGSSGGGSGGGGIVIDIQGLLAKESLKSHNRCYAWKKNGGQILVIDEM